MIIYIVGDQLVLAAVRCTKHTICTFILQDKVLDLLAELPR